MSQLQIDQVLAQIRAISAQTQSHAAAAPAATQAAPSEFANLLRSALDQVNQTQQHAGDLATAFQRGTPGVDLPQVMIETQKAAVSFRALNEVRNRLISAYQDIMNMSM
jgi:flagellar hook-basal body complex protein FliE